jgi:hypothetical protein
MSGQLRQRRGPRVVSRGPGATVIAASCLTNTKWQRQWIDPLRELGPLIVLIDVELDRFVASWATAGASVQAGLIPVSDTSGDFGPSGPQR